ncbi:MAG TPA: DinB family protein [Mycobacteriales bacterium]|nr:DinB family protein [Mycobacteriales bacterium]
MTAPTDDRFEPPYLGDERTILAGFLRYHRETLLWKCAELTPEQLAARPLPTTVLSLLGLVRHLADVERSWFRRRFAGEDAPPIFFSEADWDADILPPPDADPVADFATYRVEVEAAEAAVRGHDLGETFVGKHGETISLRWVYVHMIEEYARHNGHADLLREAIDGVTGE